MTRQKQNKCGDCIHCLIYDKDPYICQYHRPKRKQKIAIANSIPFLLSVLSGIASIYSLVSGLFILSIPSTILSVF